MKQWRVVLVVLFGIVAAQEAVLVPVPLPPVYTSLGQEAYIDWAKQQLFALGKGTALEALNQAQAELRAKTAAKADALRVLGIAARAVPINSEATIGDCLKHHPNLAVSLEASIKNAQAVPGSFKLQRGSNHSWLASVMYTAKLGDILARFKALPPGSCP